MGPSVDIVIPTNRNSSYLSETLASVQQQTFTGYAVTVVDDGSPDPDAMRAAVAIFPFVQLIRRPHEGVSAARNAGIRATSAPLVVFLDDDDLWEPKRLEIQVEALRETPKAVACYTGGYHVGPDGARWDNNAWYGDQHSRVEFLRGEYPIPRINTLMIRREALQRAGDFDLRLRMAQDKDMTLRLLQLGEMVGVDEPLVGYRRHPGNVTHNADVRGRAYSEAMIRRQLDAARLRRDAENATLLAQYLRNFRADEISNAVRRTNLFLSERQIRDATGEVAWALRRSPGRTARCVVAEGAGRLRLIDSGALERVRHAPSVKRKSAGYAGAGRIASAAVDLRRAPRRVQGMPLRTVLSKCRARLHCWLHARSRLVVLNARLAYFRIRNLVCRASLLGEADVVVSLTTYGPRLRHAYYAIESIGAGRARPKRLILWLDDASIGQVPRSLRRLVNRGLEICRTDDLGPHKKYLPYAMSRAHHEIALVTADDDILYPTDWLVSLITCAQSPDSANQLLCHRAKRIELEGASIRPYATWPSADSSAPSHKHFMIGAGGALYPPSLLHALRVAGEGFRGSSDKADDVWLNNVALRNGFRVRQINDRPMDLMEVPYDQDVALWPTNFHVGGGNDRAIAATYTDSDVAVLIHDDASVA